jgi:hypothetical protein
MQRRVAACQVARSSPLINVVLNMSFALKRPLDNAHHGMIPALARHTKTDT